MKLLSRTTERARRVAERVTDPELPMLSLADLGVLRDVDVIDDSHVVVDITPTYSGCPAMAAMRDDLVRELTGAGWITPAGRAALASAGISPPGPAPSSTGPIPLTLLPTARQVRCPQCGSPATELVSEFGSTACKAQYRCTECLEPFDHVKEI